MRRKRKNLVILYHWILLVKASINGLLRLVALWQGDVRFAVFWGALAMADCSMALMGVGQL